MFDIKYEELKQANTSSALKFYWNCSEGFRWLLSFDIFYSLLNSLLKVLSVVVFSNLIGYLSSVSQNDFDIFEALTYIFLVLILFSVVQVVRYIRESTSEKTRSMLSWRARIFAFQYVSKYPLSYIKEQKSGVIAQRIRALGENIWLLKLAFARITSCIFLIIIPVIFIGCKDIYFLLVVVILGIISSIFSFVISKKSSKLNKRTEEKVSIYNGYITDSLTNILLIKMFGEEKKENKKLDKELKLLKAFKVKTIFSENIIQAMQDVFLVLFRIISVILALFLWKEHKINLTDVVAILMFVDDLIPIFSRFMNDITWFRNNIAKLSDSLIILQVPIDIVDVKNAKNIKVKNGDIEFRNICFGYDKNKLVFDKLNLAIKSGEKIGIVGKSGSGKSTLCALLQRQYNLNAGKIMIDGKDISQITIGSLKRNITLVGQDNVLFHRTIKKNIAYSKPNALMKDIIKASTLAHADNFINETNFKYETITGERGVKLSGGQRQRIAIARAILKNAPILILDEATSQLDNKTENEIIDALSFLMQGRTVIAIAHRLSTLKNMDRIIVLDKGKIVEEGKPGDLLDKKGEFQKMWELQK
ncbi:MAG: ABC transporter ATP-binding protein [Alphaproteobacteria bacterium]|nr:ABC transporter ATP-binding protein [Alphaproteobacteria bacterium]